MAFQPAFIWGQGGQRMTPEEIARQRQIVDALMGQTDTSPVAHWTQGAARLVDALGTRLDENRLNNAEEQNAETNRDLMSALMGGVGGGPASPGASSPSVASALTEGPTETPEGSVINARIAGAHDDSVRDQVFSGLVERGMPPHVAEGFVMNFQDESGLNPSINEIEPIVPGSRGGFGLAQWTGPRRRALEAYAQQRGMPVDNLDLQMDFLMSEVEGSEAAAYEQILATQDAGSAGAAIVNHFLRPAEEHRVRRAAEYTGAQGVPQQPVQVAQSGGINPAIVQALTSPYADDSTRQMAGILLEQQLQANDPAAQLEMEIQREKLNQLRNPQQELTAEQRNLSWRAQQAGLQPGTQEYTDFMLSGGRGPETVVNNNMGGNKFAEEFAKSDATALAEISQTGLAAQRNVARIDRLDQLLSTVPTGAEANFKQIAANYGLSLGEDVDNIQAAQALINSLVPEQRPAGSGPMSDADLELFKQSLPRIINQPGGNQIIINTMRAIAQYDAQGAEIVQRLRQGEIDRSAAFEALQSRENPLAVLRDIDEGEDQPTQLETLEIDENTVPEGVDPEDWKYMSEEDRALFR